MNTAPLPYALLLLGRPEPAVAAARVDSPATIFARIQSLTSIAKTVCVLEEDLKAEWSEVTQRLWPSNLVPLAAGDSVLDGVVACLQEIARQDSSATLVLIPFNHCAVEELTWLDSVKGALRLAASHPNAVYLLHDSSTNDPRAAVRKPAACSSSVMIGAVTALSAYCSGSRATEWVDLVIDEPDADSLAATGAGSAKDDRPLNLIHIRLAEEYARLQRAEVWHRRAHRVDLHA